MPGQLSVNERVLLHLSRFATDTPPEEYPEESTQVGIAEGVGISRTHVPRAVKALIRDGSVEELRGRVAKRDRRMSVYAVTSDGFRKAEETWERMRTSSLRVVKGEEVVDMGGAALEEMLGRKQAMAVVAQMKDGVVELTERRRTPVRDLLRAPALPEFYGREQELDALESFLDSNAAFCAVLGNRGYGATSLVRRFVQDHEEADVLWIHLRELIAPEEIADAIVSFAKRIRQSVSDLDSALSVPGMIVVLDGYRTVGEDLVEFMGDLAGTAREAKMIVTAGEDTPAYNWFYQKKHVDSGMVREIRVRGLDEQSAKKLLETPGIEEEAFRRVYLMTRGQPLLLRMLRDGDAEGLKKNSVYTAEEIRYLLFLKNKTC
ncbi:TPA: ATP-binding protein [Thermoplasmata archaeon]|nr:ATP-binding protein [Thermoplasmata archaeon]